MKLINIALVGAILAIGLHFYNKKEPAPEPTFEQAVKVVSTVAAAQAVSETLKKVEEIKIESEKPKLTLPDGDFVTVNRVKEVHAEGVRAIAKGVRVKKVGEKDGKVIITDSKVTISVNPSDLTNDVTESNSLIGAALANTPPMVESTPEIPVVKPEVQVPQRPDYSGHIRVLDSQIKEIEDKINAIRRKSKGEISGSGAVIARYEIDLNALIARRNNLLRAQ
jgi:hypothetical protein